MELVDLYDENRRPLGRTAERSAPLGPGEYRTVGGGVDAGETSRQGAEREFREELGVSLDLGGLRPSATVNFGGGFDDFYILTRDLAPEELTLQAEEVQAVRRASLEEILDMLRRGEFIPYPESFLRFLFDMRNQFGFPTK